jgi:hypothetical protein
MWRAITGGECERCGAGDVPQDRNDELILVEENGEMFRKTGVYRRRANARGIMLGDEDHGSGA